MSPWLLIPATAVVWMTGFGVGYQRGRDVEASYHRVPDWQNLRRTIDRHPASGERGATLVTHAFGVATVIGLVLWASYTFGGVP